MRDVVRRINDLARSTGARRVGSPSGATASITTTVGDVLPILDQRKGFTAAFENFDAVRDPSAELPGDFGPEAVVGAVRVADPDDKRQRAFTTAHARCSCSFRKCAAQEMHGS
jgi:hypothetical protein